MNAIELKKRRRKYYLHHRVRKQGFNLVTKDKTVYLGHNQAAKATKNLLQLQSEYGYSLQLTLEI